MISSEYFSLNGNVFRVLNDSGSLIINCSRLSMPEKANADEVARLCLESPCSYEAQETDSSAYGMKIAHERYSVIASVLPHLEDERKRSRLIRMAAEEYGVTKMTVKRYLWQFLSAGKIEALAPVKKHSRKELTENERNFRWALNKFYLTPQKQSLKNVYVMMLQERYTDGNGELKESYPKFHQLTYYYRHHCRSDSKRISRNGVTEYQRNERPLLGTVEDFAPAVGVGMLDSTPCDIYILAEDGTPVRPILTLCVDAFSRMICGYALTMTNDADSLRTLMLNVISSKTALCAQFGIEITDIQWPCSSLPGVLVTDNGLEYTGSTFEQITELGVRLITLPPYRPELKGVVEKALDRVQSLYTSELKGRGVIEPDYLERGAPDYRAKACLSMTDLEKIIVRCIVYLNSQRVLENFVLSADMIDRKINPVPNELFDYSCTQPGANLIETDMDTLRLTLLPRIHAQFTRHGLMVNGLRYRHTEGNFTHQYLNEVSASAAYDPSDAGKVWLADKGTFTEFVSVVRHYQGHSLEEVQKMKEVQRSVITESSQKSLQSAIDLHTDIQNIAKGKKAE